MSQEARHVVAIVGGAVAGSEAARVFADRGAEVIVIEQNPRPYGKIEDGLPRWHDKQRTQEYARIDERLDRPGIHFVPRTALGRDVAFDELVSGWGLSALLLANGAWKDRPLPVEGIDRFRGRGLVLQNDLIYWFNHYPEAAYDGPRYDVPDGAAVFGGGLASIDVVKVLMLETVSRALRERGIDAPMIEMEHKGIPATLEKHGLAFGDLGLAGCILYYRRRKRDMPLAEVPEGATPERAEKVAKVREKILDNAVRKFCFRYQERTLPVAPIEEGGRLVGVRCQRTEVVDGRARAVAGSDFEVRAGMVVSSIGSVPQPIPGIPQKGAFYQFDDWDTGKLSGFENVYGLGNVVTGKGNIRVSRKHGAFVAGYVAERLLGLSPDEQAARAREVASAIADEMEAARAPLPPERVAEIHARVRARQEAVGYPGSYRSWIEKVRPTDLG